MILFLLKFKKIERILFKVLLRFFATSFLLFLLVFILANYKNLVLIIISLSIPFNIVNYFVFEFLEEKINKINKEIKQLNIEIKEEENNE